MLVSRQDVDLILSKLAVTGERGLDSETTGLMEDDTLFSLIIDTEDEKYYFNFQSYCDVPLEQTLNKKEFFKKFNDQVLSNPDSVWFIHNAKFDWRMLAKEGCDIKGTLHCTYAIERVVRNNYFGQDAYTLAGCAARRNLQKDEAVAEYISKHKLYTMKKMPGKKKEIKLAHFDQVPSKIMIPYGIKDGHLHRFIGLNQRAEINRLEAERPEGFPSLLPVYNNEIRLTRTCFKMEQRGIMIDKPFVAKALEYEMDETAKFQKQFEELTGKPFVDSNKLFKEVFDGIGEKYPLTAKGNPSFAADVLEDMTSPVASIINNIRYHEKRAGTYYSSFLFFANKDDVIHPDTRQAGTETGRFSYRDPNLQNVPKEDSDEDQKTLYHVRSSFIPRKDHFFYSIDYKQQEFRMMLDYAGELALIKAINEGADVHEATAQLCGITRKQAKTINFGLLYGMGVEKLAAALGISVREAQELKRLYFARLPKVRDFIRAVIRSGEARGYIFNWAGRRNYVAQKDWAYILPNHLIQGGCADVIKFAMNEVDDYLLAKKLRTMMLLQVHDELLIECPFGEERVIEPISEIMKKIYKPQNGMILDVSIEHSFKSWGYRDKIKGVPYAA